MAGYRAEGRGLRRLLLFYWEIFIPDLEVLRSFGKKISRPCWEYKRMIWSKSVLLLLCWVQPRALLLAAVHCDESGQELIVCLWAAPPPTPSHGEPTHVHILYFTLSNFSSGNLAQYHYIHLDGNWWHALEWGLRQAPFVGYPHHEMLSNILF